MLNWVIYSEPDKNEFKTIREDLDGEDFFNFESFNNELLKIQFKGLEETINIRKCKYPINCKESYNIKSTTKDSYKNGFDIIKKAIHKREISKGILSKLVVKEFDYSKLFELIESLRNKFPSALIYCVNHIKTGVWIGATPELLLKKMSKIKATTVALAGTKTEEKAEWSEKEFNEQKVVLDYIESVLKTLNLEFKVSVLKTLQTGSLYHLINEIEIKLKSSSDIYEIASKLHPTPAISGFPKEKSISVIKKAEKHNRKYYCGIIGIKNKTKETYYVNLRCGEVTKSSIIAYAGGGITEGSNIDSEWKETEAKSESILGLI